MYCVYFIWFFKQNDNKLQIVKKTKKIRENYTYSLGYKLKQHMKLDSWFPSFYNNQYELDNKYKSEVHTYKNI